MVGGYFALDYILPPLKRSNVAHETVKAYRLRLQAVKDGTLQAEPPAATASAPAAPPSEPPAPTNDMQPPAPPVQPVQPVQPAKPPVKSPSASSKGEVDVGAKESAMSLKKAIEAMNAESGEPARKPAK